MLGKQSKLPFKKEPASRANKVLDLVHSDVCGPMSVNSLGGACYFVTFIDDFSRKSDVFFITKKSEVLNCFKTYLKRAELETGNKLKVLRSDGGGEYISKEFKFWRSLVLRFGCSLVV